MAEEIGFTVRQTEEVGGVIGVDISLLRSTKTGNTGSKSGRLAVNELPYIFNSVKNLGILSDSSHRGFDYTLSPIEGDVGGFPMEQGYGFPYVMDFEIYDNLPSII